MEQVKQASLFDGHDTSQLSPAREDGTRAATGEGGNKKIAQRKKPANPGENIIASGTKNRINLKTGQYLCYDCGRDSGIGTLIKGFVYCKKHAKNHQG